MERKFLQNNWSELRSQISEWWEDLTDEDLDWINGDQERLISILQQRYGYTRNLAFVEVKLRLAESQSAVERKEKHSSRNIKALQYFGYDNEDWSEVDTDQAVYGIRIKARARDLVSQ